MNVFKVVVIVAFLELLFVSSFTGCNKAPAKKIEKLEPKQEKDETPKAPKEEKIYEEDDDEIRYWHEDIQIIRLSGFEDACKNCNRGYRTKLVCGYAYNPECSKLINTEKERNLESKASQIVLEFLIPAVKEVKQDGKD